MNKSLELIETIKEVRGIKDLAGAYAFAFGMVSAEVSEDTLQQMIDALKARA